MFSLKNPNTGNSPIAVEKDAEGNSHLGRTGFGLHQTWAEMEKLVDAGLVKTIGVSNYNVQLLNDLLNYARIKPAVNQVCSYCYCCCCCCCCCCFSKQRISHENARAQIERHPYLQNEGVVELCRNDKVYVTAYAPLGAPGLRDAKDHGYGVTPLLDNDVIQAIAAKHGKTTAQVLLRWNIDCDGLFLFVFSLYCRGIVNIVDLFSLSLLLLNSHCHSKVCDSKTHRRKL
jgi:diketogulonate reductase-like aldo/keto reductase